MNTGCWITAVGGGPNNTTYSGGGSGFTLRDYNTVTSIHSGHEDTNGTVSTGSNTVTFTTSGGTPLTVLAASIRIAPVVYALTAAVGTYILTGFAATLAKIISLTAAVGTFALTGIATTLAYVVNKWPWQKKSSATWVNKNKTP